MEEDKIEEIIRRKINEGASSHDVAMTLDVAPSTARAWAKRYGLKFKGRSYWRKR
jgi:transposase-like protein